LKYRARLQSITVLICALCGQTAWPAAPQSDAVTREMAHDIFKQLIEINTTDSIGSTTVAAQAMAPPPLRTDVMESLRKVAAKLWPGAPVIPAMVTGSSDSIYTMYAGIPSNGISGVAIDRDDVRMHGKDERLKVDSYYTGVEFYYQFLKALTAAGS
jgi:acetylornithine deacetylase/succinyl-diaminopimelate desuccinylase-like protein